MDLVSPKDVQRVNFWTNTEDLTAEELAPYFVIARRFAQRNDMTLNEVGLCEMVAILVDQVDAIDLLSDEYDLPPLPLELEAD